MKHCTTACGLLLAAVLGPFLDSADAADLSNVGSERQLFVDNAFFSQSSNVSLQLHSPTKTGQKVVERNKPWESATLNWFSVVQDQGVVDSQAKYRMWYECYDVEGWPTADDTSFCYAESRDGVQWTKPNLGLVDYQGSTNNNILFRQIGPAGGYSRVHGTDVFIDPTAPPESRYKAVSQGLWSNETPIHQITGMVSPDGINWTRNAEPICTMPYSADSQYSGFWDASLGKYVLYGRTFADTGRSIGRTESSDFAQFAPLQQVLQADGNDPANSDLYNPTAMKYSGAANVYMMFPSLYQKDADKDTLDVRMAVSRDGVNWTYPDQSKAFVPLGDEGAWDSKTLYMGQGVLQVGDETYMYYSGSPLTHQGTELEDLVETDQPRAMGLVTLARDRFVSVDAGAEGGSFVTLPLQFTGPGLKLNVDVHDGGVVRVALLDENGNPLLGHSLADCLPITGDGLDAAVRWTSGTDLSDLVGQPTRMQVELVNASLYGFQFTHVPEPSGLALLATGAVLLYAYVRRRR